MSSKRNYFQKKFKNEHKKEEFQEIGLNKNLKDESENED